LNLLLPMTIAGLLVAGMGLALLGTVKVPLARRLNIDEARVGGLVSLFGFTMILVILAAGFFTDLIGRQFMFIGGIVLMAIGLLVLASARRYVAALLAVLLLSAAWSMVVNVINVITPPAFLDPEDIPEKISYATNLGNVFFGLGAFLTPLGAVFVLRRLGLTTSLVILAGLVLVPAGLALGVDFSALNQNGDSAQAGAAVSTMSLLRDPVMWICAFALFFYGPLEASVAAWSTTYLGEKGVSEGAASSLLSGFWLSFMAARLLTALWLAMFVTSMIARFELPMAGESLTILVLAFACVAVLSGMVWGRGKRTAMAMVIVAGLVFGPIFPAIMAILLGHFEPALQGRAVGLLFAIGGLGWTFIPMMIGSYAGRTSVQQGYLIAVGSAIGLCLVGGLMIVFVLN